jgi:TorA maturation chaperone TorD
MNELPARELNRVRLRFYDLAKSFFIGQPDAAILGRWRGILTALESEVISPAIDQAVLELGRLLSEMSLEQIREEFYTLFDDPFSRDHVEMAASCYIDGKRHGQTLVAIREFLKTADIGKVKEITDSEDSLVIMLDVMVTLIEEQQKQGEENQELQDQLLRKFLLPAAALFTDRLHEKNISPFYSGCGDFLTAYLELERGLLTG